MNKRIFAMLLILALMVSLVAACGTTATTTAATTKAAGSTTAAGATTAAATTAKAFKFERKIEMVCPFGPGSGTDTTLRNWLPLMEKELGVSIVVNNMAGAGGVTGAEYFAKQPADGYTFAMYTPSHTIAAVNKTTSFDILNETMPVVRLVQDANIVLAGKKVPYNNMKELVEYVKANPGKAKIGVMSVAGIDGVSVNQLWKAAGIEVPLVGYPSGAEANAAIMGGHIDMVLTSPFDAKAYVDSGDMKGIVLLSEKRASTLANVECTGELKYDAYIGPWRGIVAKKGTPQAAIDAFEAAAIKVNTMQSWIDWKKSVALNDREGFANQKDFTKIWKDYYETMKTMLGK